VFLPAKESLLTSHSYVNSGMFFYAGLTIGSLNSILDNAFFISRGMGNRGGRYLPCTIGALLLHRTNPSQPPPLGNHIGGSTPQSSSFVSAFKSKFDPTGRRRDNHRRRHPDGPSHSSSSYSPSRVIPPQASSSSTRMSSYSSSVSSSSRNDDRPIRAVMSETEWASTSLASRQLVHYNARDIEPFLDLFADDVIVTDIDTGIIIASNKVEMRPRYLKRFESTDLHCELVSRTVLDNVVIDREVISGLPHGDVADCIATYVCDVEGDEIGRVYFVWRVRPRGIGGDGGDGDVAVAVPAVAREDEDDACIDPLTRIGLPSPLLLGSASFTRKLILSEMNVPFVKLVRPIDESSIGDRDGNASELVIALANAKMDRLIDEIRRGNCDDELTTFAAASSSSSSGGGGDCSYVMLTADQVVTHRSRILEKPDSIEDAREYVGGYADGGPVSTHGAVVLYHHPSGMRVCGIDTASVYFRSTISTCDLVDRLLDDDAPVLGCAGGLMIEHPYVREHVITTVGTEDSIMGLSKDLVMRLFVELREKLDGAVE
jgi:septum formation protein